MIYKIQIFASIIIAIAFVFYAFREIFSNCDLIYVFGMFILAFLSASVAKLIRDEYKEDKK